MRRVLAGVLAGVLVGTAAIAQTPQTPDVDRAKELYTIARKALDEGRTGDAIRDFGAAYEITKDPALFYWIGSANEKAGKCDVALIYYGRYLKEAKPSEQLLATVRQRITGCGGNPDAPVPQPVGSGSAPSPDVPTTGSGSAVVAPEPQPQPPPDPTIGSGSAPAPAVLPARNQGPWILVGGSIAMLTIGVVLAYSANASENDISDLYVGLEGNPPVFDNRTKQRYDDLIAEGERYEKLSWASFALAAGLAGGAAVWFYLGRDKATKETVVAPTVQPGGGGVSATVRW